MWSIENTRKGWAIVKPGRAWARVVGGILAAIWGLGLIGLFAGGGFFLFMFATVLFGAPAAVLIFGPGDTKLHLIRALLDVRDVAGGSLVTLVDERQRRHELITDRVTAEAVRTTLTS